LPSEVAEGVVTVDEYALLPHSSARIRLERRVLRRYGIRQWLLTRALYQTAIGLHFCEWHLSMLQYPPTDRQNGENPKLLLTSIDGDNSNGSTRSHRASPDDLAGSDSFVLGTLQPEVVYRKRIKRIREEIAALEAKRTE